MSQFTDEESKVQGGQVICPWSRSPEYFHHTGLFLRPQMHPIPSCSLWQVADLPAFSSVDTLRTYFPTPCLSLILPIIPVSAC